MSTGELVYREGSTDEFITAGVVMGQVILPTRLMHMIPEGVTPSIAMADLMQFALSHGMPIENYNRSDVIAQFLAGYLAAQAHAYGKSNGKS